MSHSWTITFWKVQTESFGRCAGIRPIALYTGALGQFSGGGNIAQWMESVLRSFEWSGKRRRCQICHCWTMDAACRTDFDKLLGLHHRSVKNLNLFRKVQVAAAVRTWKMPRYVLSGAYSGGVRNSSAFLHEALSNLLCQRCGFAQSGGVGLQRSVGSFIGWLPPYCRLLNTFNRFFWCSPGYQGFDPHLHDTK